MKRMIDWKDIGIVIDFYLFFVILNKLKILKIGKIKGLKCIKSVVVKKLYINDLCRWKLLFFVIILLRN